MLTKLRVQGFKNLLDVEVELGPFTCVAGPNGAGKSNLFDAIRFLHLLAEHPIAEAAGLLRDARGRSVAPRSLFTSFGVYRAPEMRFSAEMIVPRAVLDDFGVEAEASISTIRYEVAFRLNVEERPDRLELVEERLDAIPITRARRLRFRASKGFRDTVVGGRRTTPFVSTEQGSGDPVITVHQEGHGGRRVPAPKSSRTVLGGLASSDFPTLLAAHREMQTWQTLLLEPSAMRAPSDYRDPRSIDGRGANLPATLERLCRRNSEARERVLAETANRLAELIDDVRGLRLIDDPKTETYTLEVQSRDGVFHPAQALSDGTLRFLVLTALAGDPEATGLIAVEEPENGIHPERVPAMVRLLQDIAVDPMQDVGLENPLRQTVINTHSPIVVATVGPDPLIYVDSQLAVRDGAEGRVASFTFPEQSWRSKGSSPHRHLGRGRLRPYLSSASSTSSGWHQLSLDLDSAAH